MTWVDYRLRAPDEAAALAAAVAALAGGIELVCPSSDGESYVWRRASLRHAFDPGCPGPIVDTQTMDAPGGGEIDVPVYDADHWYANLRVVPDLVDAVDTLLTEVGAPLGVEVTPVTGRDWA